MHIHILGIGGSFMGGLAVLAQQAGHRVTGCDKALYPPMSIQLAEQKIPVYEKYNVDQVKLQPDVYVIGNVISRGNPLMEKILDLGVPYVSGPQWLRENILSKKWLLGVAGTHGKTTTAAMLAWILEYAGLQPGFLIGGVPLNFDLSARLSKNPFFVIEADEYDTAFFDKRSKFLHYPARTAILNNLEFDHADIFPDLAAIQVQFHHFIRILPSNGLLIVNGNDANLSTVLDRGNWTPIEYFASREGWDCVEANSAKQVYFKNKPQGELHWDLLGEHNQHNALAALAAARHVGVPVQTGLAALENFKGVKRRMELRGCVQGINVYDDFAHHPTAIATTLAGLKAQVQDGRVLAVLEPRSNTMKMGVMKNRLASSLALADLVFCYSQGLDWDASEALAVLGDKAQIHSNLAALVQAVAGKARPGDHIVIMSNGAFDNVHEMILRELAVAEGVT